MHISVYVTRATADVSSGHSLAVARRLVTVMDHYKEADVRAVACIALLVDSLPFLFFSKDVGR